LSGALAATTCCEGRNHSLSYMLDPKVSIYVLHEVAYLPQRYHAPFLDLMVRLRGMDEEMLNRTLMALSSKAIQRVLSSDDVKRLCELVAEGQVNPEVLERFSREPNTHVWDLEQELARSRSGGGV
jgi:hypothetical protein